MPAWKKGYTGKGVVVAVVDDGKIGLEVFCSSCSRKYLFM